MMTRLIRPIVFLVIILIGSSASLPAQSRTEGKSFWMAYPQNARYEIGILKHLIVVSAIEDAEVAVTVPSSATVDKHSIVKKLRKGETHTIEMDSTLACLKSEVVEGKGVHIGSTGRISVIAATMRKASGDTYRIMPSNSLGTHYMIVGYDAPAADPTFTTQFTAVATEDNTSLKVKLSAFTANRRSAGEEISIKLDRGQTYTVKGGYDSKQSGDLTGTLVTADKPIATITGHSCAQVPFDKNFCDVLIEMASPLERAGTEFIVPSMEGKDGYGLRIVSMSPATKIEFDGEDIVLGALGSFHDIKVARGNHRLLADRPVLVAQYALSFDADEQKIGDPFMILIPPTSAYSSESTIAVPSLAGDWQHQLTILCDERARSTLTVNGKTPSLLSGALKVADSDYRVYHLSVNSGLKEIRSEGKIAILSYGFGVGLDNFDSYGSSLGAW